MKSKAEEEGKINTESSKYQDSLFTKVLSYIDPLIKPWELDPLLRPEDLYSET